MRQGARDALSRTEVSMKFKMVCAGVGLFAAATASAGEYAVSYSNGELSTYEGVQGVHARIVRAAEQYCPTFSQVRSHKEVESCVSGVVEDLIDKVNHPELSSFHAGGAVNVADRDDAEVRDRS
jgi:UrcA family protein